MGVCAHACEWVGRGRGWGQSVGWKNSKDKRACVMCHDSDRSSGFGLWKGDRDRQTRRRTEREREQEIKKRRADQKDCSHDDEVSDWTDSLLPVCSHQCQCFSDRQNAARASHSHTIICPHIFDVTTNTLM